LEIQKADAETELAKLRIAADVKLGKEEIMSWLKSFCAGDLHEIEDRRRIIESLVNAVYIFDGKVVIYFNIKGGQQVSYKEMLDDNLEPGECSDFECHGSPKNCAARRSFFMQRNRLMPGGFCILGRLLRAHDARTHGTRASGKPLCPRHPHIFRRRGFAERAARSVGDRPHLTAGAFRHSLGSFG